MVSSNKHLNIREKIHFYFEDTETPLGRAVDFFVIALVIIASVIFVLQTYEISPFARITLEFAETIIMSIFVAEYILRFWACSKKKRHFFNVYSMIDLLAVLPFILSVFNLHILQVLRIFRILRLIRYFQTTHLFTQWGRVITIVMILSGTIFIPWQLSGLIKRLVRSG